MTKRKPPTDRHCEKLMDTWTNTIWCSQEKKLVRAQLYKCLACGKMHHRQITYIAQYSEIRLL